MSYISFLARMFSPLSECFLQPESVLEKCGGQCSARASITTWVRIFGHHQILIAQEAFYDHLDKGTITWTWHHNNDFYDQYSFDKVAFSFIGGFVGGFNCSTCSNSEANDIIILSSLHLPYLFTCSNAHYAMIKFNFCQRIHHKSGFVTFLARQILLVTP